VTHRIPVALSLAFAAAFCWPLIGSLGQLGIQGDWDYFLAGHWAPYETVRHYGQVPLWNPFVCGGMPLVGNPQSRWLSPFFLVHLLVGPELGLQLEIIAHIGLAWLGAFILGRTSGLSPIGAAAPAVVFAGCSYHYLHLAEGHMTWLAFAYLPWILAAAAANRPLLAGAGLALAIGEGGVYAAPLIVVALAFLALYRSAADRSARPIANLALAGTMAACLAAPKLLLMQPLMARYARLIESNESVGPGLIVSALFGRDQDIGTLVPPGSEYGFHEYGAYIGLVPLVLAAYGAWTSRRLALPWLLLAVLGLALSLGSASQSGTFGGDYAPWALLHRLPVFASLRVPSRFLVITVLAIGMLAGAGIDRMTSVHGVSASGAASVSRRWRLAAVGALLLLSIDLALVGPPNLRHLFDQPSVTIARSPSFVQAADGDNRRMYALARANMGALACYEPLKPDVAPIGVGEEDYRGEQYLLNEGEVSLVEWSPNRLEFEVYSNAPTTLVINVNFDESWRVVSGRGQVLDHDGLIGVSLPAGAQRVSIGYRSTRFTAGVLLALGALAVGVWRRRSGCLRLRSGQESRTLRTSIDPSLRSEGRERESYAPGWRSRVWRRSRGRAPQWPRRNPRSESHAVPASL
jgi:hypothetical protein